MLQSQIRFIALFCLHMNICHRVYWQDTYVLIQLMALYTYHILILLVLYASCIHYTINVTELILYGLWAYHNYCAILREKKISSIEVDRKTIQNINTRKQWTHYQDRRSSEAHEIIPWQQINDIRCISQAANIFLVYSKIGRLYYIVICKMGLVIWLCVWF